MMLETERWPIAQNDLYRGKLYQARNKNLFELGVPTFIFYRDGVWPKCTPNDKVHTFHVFKILKKNGTSLCLKPQMIFLGLGEVLAPTNGSTDHNLMKALFEENVCWVDKNSLVPVGGKVGV